MRPLLLIGILTLLSTNASAEVGVGDRAPAFALKSLDGATVALKDLVAAPGTPATVVIFAATWCAPPCPKALDALQGAGLPVVAVAGDKDPAAMRAFVASHKITYPVLLDEGRATSDLYVGETWPMTYVIDKKGIVRAVIKGFHQDYLVQVTAAVKALATATPAPAGPTAQTLYTLTVEGVRGPRGKPLAARVIVKPGPGLKISTEFPSRLQVTLPAGLTAEKAALVAQDGVFTADEGRFTVTFAAPADGVFDVPGVIKFGVGNDRNSYPVKAALNFLIESGD